MPVSTTATNASSSATELASSERARPRCAAAGAVVAGEARVRCSLASEVARLAQSTSAARGCGAVSAAALSVIVSFALVTRQALAQLRELASTDGERLRFPAQLQHVAIVVADALERFDVRDCDENAAVRAHKVALELVFELLQRLVDEVFAATMTNGDVFLIRAKVANLFDGHELELVADADGHVLACRERRLRRVEPEELRPA